VEQAGFGEIMGQTFIWTNMLRIPALFLLSFFLAIPVCNPEETEQLFAKANDLLIKENFIEALHQFELVLKLSEAQNDEKTTGDALYKMGVCYNSLAEYPQASEVLKRAEKIHTTLGNKEALAFDLTEKANTELLRANANGSIPLSETALRLHRETGNRKGEADTLRNIGLAYTNKGEFKKAAEYVNNSLTIAEEIQDEWGVSMSLKDEGIIYLRTGELQKARESFDRAWKIAEKIPSKKIQTRILSGLGIVLDSEGDRKGHIEYNVRSAKLAEEIGDRLQLCVVHLNNGAAYYDMNDFNKSYDAFVQAHALAEKIGNKRLLAGSLIGLAMVHEESGNDDAALNYLRKGAELSEEVGDKITLTYSLNELGLHLFDAGNYAGALKYFERALRIRQEADDKGGTAHALNYVGEVHFKIGDLDRAMQYFKDALLVGEENGLLIPMADTYAEIASVQYARKEMADAIKSAEKSFEISKQIGSRSAQWHALHIQGQIYRDTSKTADAEKAFRETVDLIESIRSDFELPEEKAGYFSEQLSAYEDLIDVTLKDNKIAEAFEYAQRSKARAFLDSLTEMRVETSSTLQADLRKRKENVINQLVEVQAQIREEEEKENPQRAALQQLEKKRIDLEEEYASVVLEIRRQNPQIAEAQYPQPTSLKQAQALLDDQTILLEYFVGESASILFAVTRDTADVFRLDGEEKLSSLISRIRDLIQKPDPALQLTEGSYTKLVRTSTELYSKLISPAQTLLQNKKLVVISPDGPLHYLPFECLLPVNTSSASPNFAQLPYIGREKQIQYVPSVSVFSLFTERKAPFEEEQRKQFLAFADPAFGDASKRQNSLVREWVGTLGPLPYTRLEVEGIAHLYAADETSVFMGPHASEENLKKLDLQQYKYVHFASHGLIDEEKPQFSSLILSQVNNDGEDGFLTVREVFDLKLNSDLVVLSACKTGLGRRIRGEGVSGLSRAFLCAGTPSVLVSLWNVYDRSTAEFMKAFYENMEKRKLNKADALKEARLQMIRSNKYSHPYYWASFVLIGKN
jgi:CHAT domain-containing protein/Tfp pilus assembly protein PilF